MDVAGQNDGSAAAPTTLPDLRQHLSDRHAKRASFEPSDRLTPLTSEELNLAARLGLVSEAAKPRQSSVRPDEAKPPRPYVAPRNELESQVAQLWKEILRVDPISVEDRFLE